MATYPVWEVGDLVTADSLTAMQADTTYKSTATTRASTVTPTDDPDLVTPTLAINASYFVEFFIRYGVLSGIGLRTAWNVPAGLLTSNKEVVGPGSAATDANSNNISMRSGVHGYATNITYGGRDVVANQSRIYECGVVFTGGTAGTIALQWAQVTSSATGSTVNAGSFVRVQRIG